VHLSLLHRLSGDIPDPAPSAPPALAAKVAAVLGIVKWTSLMAVLAVLLGTGVVLLAAERGHGAGLSPRLRSTIGSALVVLVVVGTASQLVSFLS
jgi:hypothetical protein